MSTATNRGHGDVRKLSSDSESESRVSEETQKKRQFKKIAYIIQGVVFTLAYVELAPWLMNRIFKKKIKFSWSLYEVARKWY